MRENNKIIGQIWVNNIQNNRMGHIAYRITRSHWNKGYATESLKSIVKFCFEKTELKQMWTQGILLHVKSLKNAGLSEKGLYGKRKWDVHIVIINIFYCNIRQRYGKIVICGQLP